MVKNLIKPQLCEEIRSLNDLPMGRWIAEPKYDGIRILIDSSSDGTEIYNRYGHIIPNLFELNQKYDVDFLIDGEVLAYREGKEWLQGAQKRCSTKDRAKAILLKREIPITFKAFDILRYKGRDVSVLSLSQRKVILALLIHDLKNPAIEFVEMTQDINSLWDAVVKAEAEGIIVKNVDAPYYEGERRMGWLKLKITGEAVVEITGFTEGKGSRVGFGALVMMANNKYVGKCGQGFSNEDLESIKSKMFVMKNRETQTPDGDIVQSVAPFKIKIKNYGKTPDGIYRNPIFLKLEQDHKVYIEIPRL